MARPTLETLIERARGNLSSRVLGSVSALLQHSVLEPLALVLAYLMHGLYGYIEAAKKQMMPDTATGWWLERWCQIFGIVRIAGIKATGQVTFTGTNGETVPAGSVIVRADGVRYTTDADVTISGGEATADVTAVEVGSAANTAEDVEFVTESAITGIDSACTVATGGLTGGADRESDERLRSRLLLRMRRPPQGGTASDFQQWALAAHVDVTRAFVLENTPTGGYVTVLALTDDGAGGIAPDPAVLTAVETYIEGKRPVTCTVIVDAPVAVPINHTVEVSPDTVAVRDAVEASLLAMIVKRSAPGATYRRSWSVEAVSSAVGEDYNNVTVPAADVALAYNEVAVPGTITWV